MCAAIVDEDAPIVDCSHFSATADAGNANEAFNRASLNKPLTALPNPYFEYLFADAEKISGNLSKQALGPVKSRKTNVDDRTKSTAEGNSYIDPIKRDSGGFSIPGRPASSYHNSIDSLSYEKDDYDRGRCFIPSIVPSLTSESDMTLDDAPSPPSPGPVTPRFHYTPPVNVDLSAFSQYVFHQANVPFTTKGKFQAPMPTKQCLILPDVIDSHLVAISTGLQGPIPDIDEQAALGQGQATTDFFNKLDAEETEDSFFLSPYAPETMTGQSQNVKEYDYSRGIPKEALTGTTAASLDGLDRAILGIGEHAECQDDVQVAVKPMLKPKSPKEKMQETTTIKSLTSKWIKRRQGKGQPISINTQASNSTNSCKLPSSSIPFTMLTLPSFEACSSRLFRYEVRSSSQ